MSFESLRKKVTKTGDRVDKLKLQSLIGRAKLAGRTVFPTIHPAFVLRSDMWKPVLEIDIRRCVRFVNGELTMKQLPVVGPYVVTRKVVDTKKALSRLKPIVAMDIETDGINPFTANILCVGVSDGVRSVVVDWSKGKAKILNAFLKNRWKEVVFHNGFGFDQILLKRDGVSFIEDHLEDTLQAHHTFASHLPQRLDQVVSEFMDSIPWKVKFGRRGAEEKGLAPHKMPKDELWQYNAADAQKTAISWFRMQGDLESERAVYSHDKQIALICQEMQIDGIRMDIPHRNYLARRMKNRANALKGKLRQIVGKKTFSPSKPNDIRWAIFGKFRAPILTTVQGAVTKTGLASTSAGVLEAISTQNTRAGRTAAAILHWRGVVKIKATYLDAIELGVDGRARVPWKPWGTVSGRWASRLQSTPRPKIDKRTGKELLEGRVREIYIPNDGCEFVYFDVGQAEMRFAAYLSGDKRFIDEMCSRDPYLARAKMLFPKAGTHLEELTEKGKPKSKLGQEFRQIAKTASLARNYLAEPEQVFAKMRASGFDVKLAAVIAAFDAINRTYRDYFRYVDRNVTFCQRYGYLPTPIVMRKCRLGFFPKATDVANRPIQGGIADVMNLRLIELVGIFRMSFPREDIRLVLQIHDACVFECKKGEASTFVREQIKQVWSKPVVIPQSVVCAEERTFVLPIDLKTAMRWSDL